MSADRAKLLAELTGPNAAAYQAAIESGSNAALFALLNAPHASATTLRRVPASEVVNAVAPALKALAAGDRARLQVLLAAGEINAADADTVAELRDIFTGNSAVLAKLTTIARRRQTVAEAACDDEVTLDDLAAVLPQITTSHAAKYLGGTLPGTAPLRDVFFDAFGAHDISERDKEPAQRVVLTQAQLDARRGA